MIKTFPQLSGITDRAARESLRLLWERVLQLQEGLEVEAAKALTLADTAKDVATLRRIQARLEAQARRLGSTSSTTPPLVDVGTGTDPGTPTGNGNVTVAPNGLSVVQQVAAANPTIFSQAHQNYPTPAGPQRDAAEAFVRLVVPALRNAFGPDFYLNVKENTANGTISQDAVAYWSTGMTYKEVYDIIVAAGSPSATPSWQFVGFGPAGDITLS